MRINPVSSLEGNVTVPGDKSISHRYAILAGMAEGQSVLSNFSASEDCHSTLRCLAQLGIEFSEAGSEVVIQSRGWRRIEQPSSSLDAGNSGTTIRMLSALLASRPIESVIGGDASLNRRPMGRIIDPLTKMGAEITAQETSLPPLTIKGTHLLPISYTLPMASAQVKSCILLAGLTAAGTTTVVEPVQSRDHTERALPLFGASFEKQGNRLSVVGPADLRGLEMRIPGDISSAVFFIAAAVLLPGSHLRLPGIGVNPTRAAFLELLEQAGASIERENLTFSAGEPICDLVVRYDESFLERFPSVIEGTLIPNLIDEIPILAVLGTRLRNGLTIRDAGELRKKESDRILSITSNLKSLGLEVEETAEGFHIPPGQRIRGGSVSTYGDHRIAMSFAVAGLIAEGPVEIDDPACAGVSFPRFFEVLSAISK